MATFPHRTEDMTPAQRKAATALAAQIKQSGRAEDLATESRAQSMAHAWLMRHPYQDAAEVLKKCRDLAERDGCGCAADIILGLKSEAWEPVAAALLLAK
jgi:hypothetical protein